MKVDYYYDGQFRRVLKHLIRIFGEFQVKYDIDSDGNPVYRKVPCRYADISRMASYIINGASENVLNSAPIMTISVQSLKMDRSSIRSPVKEQLVLGTNKSPAVNEYTDVLDERFKVDRMNPVPWKFVFDLNIWTTSLTNKMELFEQITTLFAPSVTLQLSDNPLDWTSASDVELVDCQFSSRSMPQGTSDSDDLDIMTLSFETTIWLSLPATVTKPKLIQEIIAKIKAGDELDIELGSAEELTVDVFTPKNMCIKVEKLSSVSKLDTYKVTLISSTLNELSSNGNIFSWEKYFGYLEPDYEDKNISVRFQQGIEESNPIKGTLTYMGSAETSDPNVIHVLVDSNNYNVSIVLSGFITEEEDLKSARPEQNYVNLAPYPITYLGVEIPTSYIAKIKPSTVELIDPSTITGYAYNSDDGEYYRYNTKFSWHNAIMSVYRQGYWRIGFSNK